MSENIHTAIDIFQDQLWLHKLMELLNHGFTNEKQD